MDLNGISNFIDSKGLGTLLIIGFVWGGYLIFAPLIKKKFEKTIDEEGDLEDQVSRNYFELVNKSIEKSDKTNEKLLAEMSKISTTNEELSKTNRQLVDSYGFKIRELETKTEDIQKTVEKINTKIDVIIR